MSVFPLVISVENLKTAKKHDMAKIAIKTVKFTLLSGIFHNKANFPY